MLRYCIVCNNVVENVILWDGMQEFIGPENCQLIQHDQAGIGWLYVNGEFKEPPPEAVKKEDLIEQAMMKKQALIQVAAKKIDPLADAVELGMATDKETAELRAWKMYRVMLTRVDPEKAPDITWPPAP
jgi:hypothetical protein